jgi:oligoendopeptidase F
MPPATPSFPAPPARRLPPGFDAGDRAALQPAFDELLARPLPDGAALEEWLLDADELESALEGAATDARLAALRDTRDEAARARHLRVQQELLPWARPQFDRIDRRYLDHPARAALPPARWAAFDRLRANRAALFREANVPLAARESGLVLEHDRLLGGLTVEFRGKRHTPQGMARWLDQPDRAAREQAFRALAGARLALSGDLSALFDQLLALRRELAANAGFLGYRDYRFRELARVDYGPAECSAFAQAIEEQVLPVVSDLREARRRALGLPVLRPWDLAADPSGRPPLRPFRTEAELRALAGRLLRRVDPALAGQFEWLAAQGRLDLPNRPGKAPGAFCATRHDLRLPHIHANAVGQADDVRTLLHESGHAFHVLAARGQPVLACRKAPIEFAEVASMSLELLGAEQLDAVLPPADAARARRQQLEHALLLLPWVATLDSFQHWLYTYPEHTREERAAFWIALRQRFDPDVDWSGHMDWLAVEWQRVPHLFRQPFYFIEYGLAQVGALQVWLNARNHGREAVEAGRAALALGGSRPLPELFTAAHACFDFGPSMLGTLTRAVREALAELDDPTPAGASA